MLESLLDATIFSEEVERSGSKMKPRSELKYVVQKMKGKDR